MKAILLLISLPVLTACGTTIQGQDQTGAPVIIKAGWGNEITVNPSIKITPDEKVVNAGRGLAETGMRLAPDIVARIAERRSEQ